MNAKKAKAIRGILKSEGVDVRFASYDIRTIPSDVEGELPTNQITLNKNCGRKLYKEAKRIYE